MSAFVTAKIIEGYRSVLEDRAEVMETGEGLVVVLADGAGGSPGGAEAAEAVVRAVLTEMTSLSRLRDPRAWSRLLAEIDQALLDDPDAGETTAVVASISAAGIAGASVGDSGAWLIAPNGYDDLTENQRLKPFLGTGAAIPVPFTAGRLEGTLLVASDGLFKYADESRICETAREEEIELAAKHLVDLVRLRSGALPDDVSVVLCRSV
jgi:PPM family protein phosphatase